MNNALMFSSKSDEWSTPKDFYNQLHTEFDFQIDLAATSENAQCLAFYSIINNALERAWHQVADRGWLNPPYSRGLCGKFIADGVEIRLLPGRLKFGGCKDAAPFPSMVVVFRP